MVFVKEFIAVFQKELLLEWKQKYAINGLLLYVISMVVIISISFMDKWTLEESDIVTINLLNFSMHAWNVLFWIIMLFTAINVVAKSFMSEDTGQLMYQYQLANPAVIILAKTFYNTFLLITIGGLAFFLYAFLSDANVQNVPLFLLTIVLGAFSMSANLSLISAIASKAENKTTLLAVLSFPIIVPILLILIEISQKAIDGYFFADNAQRIWIVFGLSVALTLISTVLFPFIWRD